MYSVWRERRAAVKHTVINVAVCSAGRCLPWDGSNFNLVFLFLWPLYGQPVSVGFGKAFALSLLQKGCWSQGSPASVVLPKLETSQL